MFKLYLALLSLALVGFAVAVVDLKDERVEKLLDAGKDFLSDDYFKADDFRYNVNYDFNRGHLKHKMMINNESGQDMTDFVLGLTATVAYRITKYEPEKGIDSQDKWMAKMNEKVVEPCKKVVKAMGSYVKPVQDMKLDFTTDFTKGPHTLEIMKTQMVQNWLQRIDACEKLLADPEYYGELSFEAAEDNNLLSKSK